MKSGLYKSLVKGQVEKTAFKNLLNKKENGQKGSNIEHTSMKLADYLHPECEIALTDKYKKYSIRSEMNDFPSNYGNKTFCTMGCLEILNSEHVTMCPRINEKGKTIFEYKNILNGSMKMKILTYKQFKENIITRINQLRDSVI